MRSLHRASVWCLVVLLTACNRTPPQSRQPSVPPLATLVLQPEQARREQVWDGVVEAVDDTTIAAQTNARVLELPYDVDDRVAKGEVLVRFSDVEQQSGRRSAVAAVAAAQATLDEAQAAWKRIDEIYRRKLVATCGVGSSRRTSRRGACYVGRRAGWLARCRTANRLHRSARAVRRRHHAPIRAGRRSRCNPGRQRRSH